MRIIREDGKEQKIKGKGWQWRDAVVVDNNITLQKWFDLDIWMSSGHRRDADQWLISVSFKKYPTENEIIYWITRMENEASHRTGAVYASVNEVYRLAYPE